MSYDEHLISQAGGDGDELDQIQRRADKATPGPWGWDHGNPRRILDGKNGEQIMSCAVLMYPEQRNADFIAHARTDVPYLLALVREQQAKLDELRDLANAADINDQQFGDGNGGSVTTEAIRAALSALESKP